MQNSIHVSIMHSSFFFFFYLIEKVQKELDAVLGPYHLICYEDRKKLPYTNAVIHEIMRFGSIILITFPRQTVKDTTVLGYWLPKVQISFLFQCDHWPWIKFLAVMFPINPFSLQFRTDECWWQHWQTALFPSHALWPVPLSCRQWVKMLPTSTVSHQLN